MSSTHVEADIATLTSTVTSTESGLHVGAGVRRELEKGGNIGVRVELDDVDSNLLIAVRALDYRYSISNRLAVGGIHRSRTARPRHTRARLLPRRRRAAQGARPGWDLSIDLRLGDKLARDNVLPTDPQGGRPDNFYDLTGVSVYLSRRF